ncbi:hypothetical protein ABW20_dc0106509 [Dactylellina cionopaga]|nr:hypothetical protein ABW20_dc0106509 [Dactylellina cionopaga]
MGLAGPSKKRKISHDPNNTTWTRSEGFGHRMLTSQGWAPGTILGPDPNNPHHTLASQTGIKVMLKDDTLGIGCRGSQEDTCTGLGDLQSLLGRLNGKSDESVKNEEDARRNTWIQGRYGMRFVKGEVLESTWVTKGLKRNERAAEASEDTEMVDSSDEETKSSESDSEDEDSSEGSRQKSEKAKREKSKKDEKKKKKAKGKKKSTASESEDEEESSSSSTKESKSDKAKRRVDRALRKAERLAKRERKATKRLRKEEKRRAKAEKKILKSAIANSFPSSTVSTPPALPSTEPEAISKPEKKAKSLPNSLPTSGTSTPMTGRQALRSKWIAQKRMSVMDAKALNEILMIKAS